MKTPPAGSFTHSSGSMAHYLSRAPSPAPSTSSLGTKLRHQSILSDFIEVAERQREGTPMGPLYVPLPHESDTSEADMEEREQVRADTPTRDKRDSQAQELPAKRDPSLGAVPTPETQGRRLVLAATYPTYTPSPISDLHSGLRMVVADLTQTFSPPPYPVSGDQWRGANYVPTPVAELERLEEWRRELETEVRDRRAGYSIR